MNDRKVLHLTLKKEWFDLMISEKSPNIENRQIGLFLDFKKNMIL